MNGWMGLCGPQTETDGKETKPGPENVVVVVAYAIIQSIGHLRDLTCQCADCAIQNTAGKGGGGGGETHTHLPLCLRSICSVRFAPWHSHGVAHGWMDGNGKTEKIEALPSLIVGSAPPCFCSKCADHFQHADCCCVGRSAGLAQDMEGNGGEGTRRRRHGTTTTPTGRRPDRLLFFGIFLLRIGKKQLKCAKVED